jgi:outer membrane protein OmpA-like peptidoglycan-associated protein
VDDKPDQSKPKVKVNITASESIPYNMSAQASAGHKGSATRKSGGASAAAVKKPVVRRFDDRAAYGGGYGAAPTEAPAPKAEANQNPDAALDRLAEQLKKQAGKVMLQGFARNKDSDKNAAALRRANAVRDGLISRGVSPDQVEAVSANAVSESQAVRIVADVQSEKPRQAQRTAEESKDPVGSAYFMAGAAMTIEKYRSAIVSLLKSDTKADRVYYYDPISSRGSKEFAFQAVRIENPSNYTLDRGPITVYEEGQFLGEGLSEAIPPKSAAFIPYALDRQLVVEPASEDRDEIRRLVTIQRGMITAEVEHIRKTTFSLHNRGDREATVYVRHAVAPGWELRPTKLPTEKLSGNYLFQVRVPARGALKVDLEEAQPLEQTIDIRTRAGAAAVGLYLKHPGTLDPKLRAALDEILALYKEMADAEQKIATLGEQMNEYRKRVDELNVELVTLRRVKAAQDLSRHLAKKMQEVSERLQKATIRVADLQEELMTRRIRVEDKLADLTLSREPAPEKIAGK